MNDTKHDFNFLIDEQTSLAIRLISEIISQTHEFRTDPKGYIKSSLANDCIGRKRGRLLLFGMAVGTIFLSSVLLMTILFYYSHPRVTTAGNSVEPFRFTPLYYPNDVRFQPVTKSPDKPTGGGGSGNGEQMPPSYGVPPPSSLTPTIDAATTHPLENQDRVLPVIPTILAQPIPIPDQLKNLPFGVLNGQKEIPSDGPGNGPGIGTGNGSGIGPGTGGGEGPGYGGNRGGGSNNNKLPGSDAEKEQPLSAKMVILTRPRPDYTEEARTVKVQGTVIIEATFRADGQITNVHVIRGLGFGLDEKAIQAVMQIRFRPAERQGRPVDVKQRISVSFQLL